MRERNTAMNDNMILRVYRAMAALFAAMVVYVWVYAEGDASMAPARFAFWWLVLVVYVFTMWVRAKRTDMWRGRAHHDDHGTSLYCHASKVSQQPYLYDWEYDTDL